MKEQRNVTELVGNVIEMIEDNKRFLVMPFELRGDSFDNIIGTIEGEVTYDDLVYKNRVVIIPLEELPETRKQATSKLVEGVDFIVSDIRPEEEDRVKLLNESMLEVLENTKELYKNLTQIKELEEKERELKNRIKKLRDSNSVYYDKWSRPANNSYLLELCRKEVKKLDAKKRLEDPDRPLYKTSLTGKSNATKEDVLELLKQTSKPTYYRFGFAYRGAKAELIEKQRAIDIWQNGGRNGGFLDMTEEKDKIVINEYSSNDMY